MPGIKPGMTPEILRPEHRSADLSLADRLAARIRAEGPISVHDYMAACLSHPDAGYYRVRAPIGEAGDFITAPEISQIFGELIGVWCVAVWQSMGAPQRVRLIELGPGRGTLMADLLRAARVAPAFLDAVQVHLVEQSEALIVAQRAALAGRGAPVDWIARIEDVPDGPAIVIGNEFLDALPVRQFVRAHEGWRERCVGLGSDGRLHFVIPATAGIQQALPTDTALDPGFRRGDEGDIVETRPAADALVASLAARAEAGSLAALLIDYGHARSGFGDTLQAVRAHLHADPLQAPGANDLTAHVDFAALARAAEKGGLHVHGPMAQGKFLTRLGLPQRLERLCASATPEQREALASGAARLVEPAQMGTLFKAIALTSGDLPAPPPWDAP